MSTNPIEQGKQRILEAIASQRYEFPLLSDPELIDVVKRLLDSQRLSEFGKSCFDTIYDYLLITDPSDTHFARSINEASAKTKTFLEDDEKRIGLFTGGLEVGLHHIIVADGVTIPQGLSTLAIGVEEPDYIRNKGREPLFPNQQDKVSLWARLAPNNSIIFNIPLRPEAFTADEYYDWLVQKLGLWKDPRAYYIGQEEIYDPVRVEALKRRAYSPENLLLGSVGFPPTHTSEYIVE